MPLRLLPLAFIVNPQPDTAEVLHALLDWIDRADLAHQAQELTPPPARLDGSPLFPDTDWWLTNLERRYPREDTGPPAEEYYSEQEEQSQDCASNASWSSAESDSDASLPAGPAPSRRRPGHAVGGAAPTNRVPISSARKAPSSPPTAGDQRGEASQEVSPRPPHKRLRGKQPSYSSATQPTIHTEETTPQPKQPPPARPRSLLLSVLADTAPAKAPELPPADSEAMALSTQSVSQMPSDLRLRAKRGDSAVHLH